MKNKIPIKYFIATFLWSWCFWLIPIVLNKIGIISESNVYMSKLAFPFIGIGAFGPMFGAFLSLRLAGGKGAVKNFLKPFLSLKFGWKAWIMIFLILGLAAFIAWFIPELFGVERIKPYIPFYIFPVYLIAMMFFWRRPGRIWLERLHIAISGK